MALIEFGDVWHKREGGSMFIQSIALFFIMTVFVLSGCGGSDKAAPATSGGGANAASSEIHWRSMEGYDSQGGK
jgi:hypothetical protein